MANTTGHKRRPLSRLIVFVAVALLATAGSPPHPSAATADLSARAIYDSPVEPILVARLFDPPPRPWNAGHRGIDLVSEPGQEVRTPGPGVVTFAGTVVDRGVVTVLHANGLRSSLEPVVPTVSKGDTVTAHQVVGHVEDSAWHCHPRHCVHWGLRRGDAYLNPLDWLVGFGPVRLLPWQDSPVT